MTPRDIVRLTVNSPSLGDRRRVYGAGHQFRFVELVDNLPDAAAVQTEYHYGDRARQPPRSKVAVQPLALVQSLTPDRSRLLFRPADLERVAAGATSADA